MLICCMSSTSNAYAVAAVAVFGVCVACVACATVPTPTVTPPLQNTPSVAFRYLVAPQSPPPRPAAGAGHVIAVVIVSGAAKATRAVVAPLAHCAVFLLKQLIA